MWVYSLVKQQQYMLTVYCTPLHFEKMFSSSSWLVSIIWLLIIVNPLWFNKRPIYTILFNLWIFFLYLYLLNYIYDIYIYVHYIILLLIHSSWVILSYFGRNWRQWKKIHLILLIFLSALRWHHGEFLGARALRVPRHKADAPLPQRNCKGTHK